MRVIYPIMEDIYEDLISAKIKTIIKIISNAN